MTKGDWLLIVATILICLVSIFFIKNNFNRLNDSYVLIRVAGEDYKRIKLVEKMPPKKIEVRSDFGYNLVEVDSSGARVLEASCPDKLDVKFGKIREAGEIIVCLPNKLTIEIVGGQGELEIDGISR